MRHKLMQILGIIRQERGNTSGYAPSAITYTEFLTTLALHEHYYLVVVDDAEHRYYLDFSNMLKDQPVGINNIVDWETMGAFIDEAICEMYAANVLVPQHLLTKVIEGDKVRTILQPTQFASNIQTQLNVHSVDNNLGITVAYSSRKSPSIRNLRPIRHNLKDLVFTHTGTPILNFRNTIPVVNGVTCYPSVYDAHQVLKRFTAEHLGLPLIPVDDLDDPQSFRAVTDADLGSAFYPLTYLSVGEELFAYEGANLLRKQHTTPKGLVLIDFSELGDLEVHRLSDCDNLNITDLSTKTTTILPDGNPTRIKFEGTISVANQDRFIFTIQLPEGASSGLPLVSIAGRLFFPSYDDVSMRTKNGRKVVTLTLTRHLLERIVLTNLQKFSKEIKNTLNINVNIDELVTHLFDDHVSLDWFLASVGATIGDPTQEETVIRRYFADTCVPFVAIIKTEQQLICRLAHPMTIAPDKFRFVGRCGGLLINSKTREIVDYVRTVYEQHTLVTMANWKPLELFHRDSPHLLAGNILGTSKHNYQRSDQWNPIANYTDMRALENYHLLDFARI